MTTTTEERVKAYRSWITDLEVRELLWLQDHPDQKMLPVSTATPADASLVHAGYVPTIRVYESGGGFWEVLVDGRMVFGCAGEDAHQRATKRASDILKEYGVS